MSKSAKPFSPLVIVGFTGLLAAVVGLGWKLSEPVKAPVIPPQVAPAPQPKHQPPSPPSSAPRPNKEPVGEIVAAVPPTPPPAPIQPDPPRTRDEQAALDADIKMGTIIEQEKTPEATRDKLLLLFPNMSKAEKIAAAPHIVNLTGDEDLPRVTAFLKSPLTPPEAQETFFNDMLNRPPELGWPVLVDLIRERNHPLAGQAKEILTTIVGEDFGNDATKWEEGLWKQLESQGVPRPGSAAPNPQQ